MRHITIAGITHIISTILTKKSFHHVFIFMVDATGQSGYCRSDKHIPLSASLTLGSIALVLIDQMVADEI